MAKLLDHEAHSLYAWIIGRGFCTPKGDPMEFSGSPYLADMYNDNAREMVVRKSSQARVSTMAIFRALWFAHLNRITTIFTEPTRDDAQKFSATRVKPIIQQNAYLWPFFTGGTEVLRASQEPYGVPRSTIHFRGTWGEKEAFTVDADEIIIDEVDQSNQEVIPVFDTRLIASRYKRKLYISTPSIPSYGIDQYWRLSDQCHWLLKCPGCNRWINPVEDFYRILSEERVDFFCYQCGHWLNRAAGEWVAAKPGATMRGYQINQVMMLYVQVSGIIAAMRTQRPRSFANYYLGVPSDEGVGQVTREMIEAKCFLSRHAHSQQAVARRRVMGVDQGDRIYCEIREIDTATGRSLIVDLPTTRTWDDLYTLMRAHEIESCVIDARPEIRLARQFARDFPGRVFCCEYATIHEPVRWVTGERYFIAANRTQALDAAAEDIAAGITQLYWPRDDDIDGEGGVEARGREGVSGYIQHWENQRRLEPEKPDDLPVWREVGPDHRTHASVYAKIAESRIRGKPINEMWAATAGSRVFTPSPALEDMHKADNAQRLIPEPQTELPVAPKADLGRPPARTLYRGRG